MVPNSNHENYEGPHHPTKLAKKHEMDLSAEKYHPLNGNLYPRWGAYEVTRCSDPFGVSKLLSKQQLYLLGFTHYSLKESTLAKRPEHIGTNGECQSLHKSMYPLYLCRYQWQGMPKKLVESSLILSYCHASSSQSLKSGRALLSNTSRDELLLKYLWKYLPLNWWGPYCALQPPLLTRSSQL